MNKFVINLMIVMLGGSLIAGELTGNVKYVGKAPKAKRLRMDADPVCASSHQEAAKSESFIVMEIDTKYSKKQREAIPTLNGLKKYKIKTVVCY